MLQRTMSFWWVVDTRPPSRSKIFVNGEVKTLMKRSNERTPLLSAEPLEKKP